MPGRDRHERSIVNAASLRLLSALGLLVLLLALHGAAAAAPDSFQKQLETWQQTLELIQDKARLGLVDAQTAKSMHADLDTIEGEIGTVVEGIAEKRRALETLLNSLGPAPKEGEPSESEAVASERARLQNELSAINARKSQAELLNAQVAGVRDDLNSLVSQRLVDHLEEQTPLPFEPSTLRAAAANAAAITTRLSVHGTAWFADLADRDDVALRFLRTLLVVIALILGAMYIRLRLLRRFEQRSTSAEPAYRERFVVALLGAVAYGLIPAAITAGVYFRVDIPDSPITGLTRDLVKAVALALFYFFTARAVAMTILSPGRPRWQLLNIGAEGSRRIYRWTILLLALIALALAVAELAPAIAVGASLDAVAKTVLALAALTCLIGLVRRDNWRRGRMPAPAEGSDEATGAAAGSGGVTIWGIARALVLLLAAGAVGAALIGHANVTAFVLRGLFVSGLVLGGVVILRSLLRELVGVAFRSAVARRHLALEHEIRSRLKSLVRTALDPVLAFILLIGVLPAWGVPASKIREWLRWLGEGVQIGGVTISLYGVLFALAIFVGAVALTRIAQRAVTERLLKGVGLNDGIRYSVGTGISFLGYVIAIALGIAALGIDLTNLALVAGALSVGIGFGLQNIVNNFVSGIILLFERPIKVGDWVVVGSVEGFVKEINIRATEIETFQRSSIIIPNADLISQAVTNWTYKDRYGRMEIAVGVAYGSDVQKVRKVLLSCAEDHRLVARIPAPFVVFADFGASELAFELRCYTADVLQRLTIASELRYEIDRRFKEEGIEIPFPQRVIHFAPGTTIPTAPPAAAPASAPAEDSAPPRPDDRTR
ncbi:mechanosensitive ion channel domain-containing protein [Oceanibacterium hippocampi]|uniref:Mechanosensitive channel MscK n=1 Tax=Oceanibacterium hippocampi TaxID=745714 RepID=A0A1Y5RX70_9PROT|nr:mechanosensitive ion channel domain-containing protein [Oceanibacterium hippocampi]SLN26220.1 Mechanosensitive channel MscK precursor [Oceanibacterium hippocampi]